MIAALATLAVAATLEVYATPEAGLSARGVEPTDGVVSVTAIERGWRVDTPGGWVRLVSDGDAVDLWLDADQHATVQLGTARRASGDGAATLQQLLDLDAYIDGIATLGPDAAAANASAVRAWLAVHPASPSADRRALAEGLGRLAMEAADRSTEAIFRDDEWYRRLDAALDIPPDVLDVPTFWDFGWNYGRHAGGVRAYGVERAIDNVRGRTDEIALHPALSGTLYWALESASTPEQLDATDRALARWASWGAPERVLARYRAWLATRRATLPGAVAPEWSEVVDDAGAPASLAGFRGRPVVVDFWGTWCGPCIAAIPDMVRLARSAEGRAVVVAIAKEEPGGMATWKATLRRRAWGPPAVHLYTESGATAEAWSVVKYPTYAVIDADGRIVGVVDHWEGIGPLLEEALGR